MAEIAAIPWNGFGVVSTFSGCGGSCLGYRMAGFKVLWASEFIPLAQDVYRANHPDSILDTRDIRSVKPEEILEATGKGVGEIDLLDGSPPCASFSTAGKRSAGWGKIKEYSNKKQRVDDLFFEYARLLKGLQPKTFVAENVSGLVKGVAKGYFRDILASLKACGYRVECKLLDASWLGVPQARNRLIFVGVRDDLGLHPVFPKPLAFRYSVKDALEIPPIGGFHIDPETDMRNYAIGRAWRDLKADNRKSEKYYMLSKVDVNRPFPTLVALYGSKGIPCQMHPTEPRKFRVDELKRFCSFPDDFKLSGSFQERVERLGRAVPPIMMSHVASAIRDGILSPASRE